MKEVLYAIFGFGIILGLIGLITKGYDFKFIQIIFDGIVLISLTKVSGDKK